MFPYAAPKRPLTSEEVRERRKREAQAKIGRPSNVRRFDGEIYRLHDPKGHTKKEAQQIAERLRGKGYKVRIIAPLVVGDRFSVFHRKHWVFKRRS